MFIMKKQNVVRIADSEHKCNQLAALGFSEAQEEKPKPEKKAVSK